MSRLTVQKTLKMYVGGKFIRSESGRTTPLTLPEGTVIHVANASRKDLRDAVGTADACTERYRDVLRSERRREAG